MREQEHLEEPEANRRDFLGWLGAAVVCGAGVVLVLRHVSKRGPSGQFCYSTKYLAAFWRA
jgi:hypothetical protein